jgi:hypothetical protein
MTERCERNGALAILTALLATLIWMFQSALFESMSALSGDNLIHSLPFHYLLSEFVRGRASPFWSSDLALGYPVYADGTGGFFHPALLALFAAFDVLTAHDLVYLTSFAATGLCAFGVARRVGLSPIAASLAGIFAAFSPSVLWNLYNAAYAHALAGCAVMMLAFEWWERLRSARATIGFAGATALAFLAGYPPLVYAMAVLLGLVLVVRIIEAPSTAARRLAGFTLALSLGAALAGLQLLPLVELASVSSREAVTPLQNHALLSFLVGMFLVNDPDLYRGAFPYFLAPLGTFVAVVGVGCMPLVRKPFARSYLVASVICLSAAGGIGSPGFTLFHAILPGFDRLRSLSPFLLVAVVPLAVLVAAALEAGVHETGSRARWIGCGMALATAVALVLVARPTHVVRADYLAISVAVALGSAAAIVIGRVTRWRGGALLVVSILALGEVWLVRADYLRFFPDELLDAARPLASFLGDRLREEPGARVVHLWRGPTQSQHDLQVYSHWKSAGYSEVIRANAARLLPNLNVTFAIPALHASDALPIAGMPELRAEVRNQIVGSGPAAGLRSMDRLGIRYVIADVTQPGQRVASDLREVWRDPSGQVAVLENAGAVRPRPSLEVGGAALIFEAATEDLHGLRPPLEPLLPPPVIRALEALPWLDEERVGPVSFDRSTAGPVFLSIVPYPGWSAWIDGNRVPVRAAPPVGLWIDVPAGTHRLELRFVPHAFLAGCLVSAAALTGLVFWATRSRCS